MKTFFTTLLFLLISSLSIAQSTLDSGLVAYFPFNGNANDESGNGFNGIIHGATLVQDKYGNANSAFQFNGVSDDITVSHDPLLTLTQQITLTAWVKRTRFGIDMIVEKGGDWTLGTCNYGMSLHYINNNMFYFFFSGGWRGTSGVNDYDWHHYAIVAQQGQQNPLLYIDGELKPIEFSEGASVINLASSSLDLHIGSQLGTYPYYGANIIDDIRIYERLLTEQEIYILAGNKGLVAFFPFNGNAIDESGNGNDGINHNGIFSKDRFGNDNSSMLFSGNDSYVEGTNPGNNLPTGNSPRTITAWIKEYSFHPWGNNIFHYGLDQAAPTNFHLYTTDVIRFGNGYDFGVVAGTTPIVDSTWHFVAGVYEGGSEHIAKVYVDGKLDGTGVLSTEPNTILGSNWKIGRFMTGSNNFDGGIDELKVYNVALSDQQIWDMYKATTTAPTLLYPGNDSTLINPYPTIILNWDSTVTANQYRLLIASDSLFNTIIKDTLTNTSSFDLYYEVFIYSDNLYWKVRTINDGGVGPWSEVNHFNFIYTDVKTEDQLPTEFALKQNYPNPFNPSTKISYQLPVSSNVTLKVFDVLGNEVATLVDEEKPAGVYEINFNSNKLASGVYLYKLQAGGFTETRKMILMR